MFERTKAQCDTFLEMGVPGFDFLVYKDGREFFRYMGGVRELESGTPIRGDERCWLYSCSKPITCTAAMQLWEQGKFSLEDKLSDYLPSFRTMTVAVGDDVRPAERPILIGNLFTMTAGFSYNYRSPRLLALRQQTPDPTTRQVVDALAQEPLLFEPGDQYRYSLCHDVLGALIEEVSGKRLDHYIKECIFDRLGMEHSTYHLPEEELSTMAPLYRFDKATGRRERLPRTPDRVGANFISGGGGCVSTAADYMKFAEGLRSGQTLLKRDTIRMMAADRLTEHQKRTFTLKERGYGLGMWTPKPGVLRQDFGWGGAAGAMLAVDEGRGLSMVYLQHMLNSPNQGLRGPMLNSFLSELEGIEPVEADSAASQNYSLTY